MNAAIPMTRDVIVVPPEMSLADAWSTMQRERIRHLPVIHEGVLVGILSDRDVLVRATLEGTKVIVDTRELVGAAMTPAPFVCGLMTPVDEIVEVMTKEKVDAVPVVSQADHLLGLVTSTDLLLLLRGRSGDKRTLPFDFKIHEAPLPNA
jgi:acetoin utilization protein AcuB